MMKKQKLLLIALCALLSLPLHGYAELSRLPPVMHERQLRPAPETPAPSDTPAPAPTVTPAPEPTPEADSVVLGCPAYTVEIDMAEYYLTEMEEAAVSGSVSAGHAAEAAREAVLASGGAGEPVAFDDLYLLARVIDAMAGSDWLTEDFRMAVGEVVLNRVASPEFPNTLREVVYQRGQYTVVNTARFSALVPRRECVEVAARLLQGERRMVPAVVYQADYLQGELFTMYPDRRLGNTYFCLSRRLELYD